MIAIEFPEVNLRIAEHQEEFETLPVFRNEQEQSSTMCFKLNKEEIEEVIKTGVIWFKVIHGGPFHPICLSTQKSDLIP